MLGAVLISVRVINPHCIAEVDTYLTLLVIKSYSLLVNIFMSLHIEKNHMNWTRRGHKLGSSLCVMSSEMVDSVSV